MIRLLCAIYNVFDTSFFCILNTLIYVTINRIERQWISCEYPGTFRSFSVLTCLVDWCEVGYLIYCRKQVM